MRGSRLVLSLLVVVVTACSCTGSGADDDPSSRTATSAGPSSGSTTTRPKPEPRVTGFAAAWKWTSPLATTKAAVNQTSHLAQDGSHAVAVTSFSDSGSKIDKSTRTFVTGLDVSTGRQLWRHAFPGAPTSLQLSSGTALLTLTTGGELFSSSTVLMALDAATGTQRWVYEHAFTPPEEDVAPPVVDGSVYLNATGGGGTYLTAVDIASGKRVKAIKIDTYAAPVPGGDLILLDSGTFFEAYPADLSKIAWRYKVAEAEATREFTVGDTAIRVDGGKHTVYGHDLATGKLLWTTEATINDPFAYYWITAGYVLVSTFGLAEAIDAATGKIVWQVYQRDAPRLAQSATADDNLLACGGTLASIDAPSGKLYGSETLPIQGFKNDCVLAPVAAKDSVLVASATTVAGYRLTVTDGPVANAGDGFGNWGAVDPDNCDVDDTTVRTALTAVFPGTWRIAAATTDGVCVWARGTFSVTVRPKTAAEAKAYLQAGNPSGGCTDAGASSGTLHRVDVSGRGLPAGSGACYQTGLAFGDTTISDTVAGATRLATGQWASFFYFVGHNKAVSSGQPARALALLSRLAG